MRVLEPGEIDADIDTGRLAYLPAPLWDRGTISRCTAVFRRWVEPGAGTTLPDSAFCDLSRSVFLEFLVQHYDLLLFGTGNVQIVPLEPVVLSQNVNGWNRPRHFAFSESIFPLFQAITDQERLSALKYPWKTTLVHSVENENSPGYYFGLDYRALPLAPWRSGFVDVYSRADFPLDFDHVPGCSEAPIWPLARIAVRPWDWPLLDRVHGLDIRAQLRKQQESYIGFPWPDDGTVHPYLQFRALIGEIRRYIGEHHAEKHSLKALGERFGISPFALLRLFRALTGLSPHEYQTLHRIDAARQLLRDQDAIAGVAAEVGFYDQTHLTRQFQQVLGITPGQYLKHLAA